MSEQVNNLTNVAVSASGDVDSLLIEKFNGRVNEQYLKGENLQTYFDMQEAVGTNMISNKYLGDTELQVLTPGQTPDATESEQDKNALVIDTVVIARNAVFTLHDVQGDIDSHKGKLAKSQTKQLKKLEDHMIIQQLLLGAISNTEAVRTTPRVSGHGFSIKVTISDDQGSDPNTMLAAIEYVMEKMLEQEVELDEMVCLVPWAVFNVLADAERLISAEYMLASGVSMKGFVLKRWNVPVVPSNRFPVAVHTGDDHHKLSNAANGYRYDVTTEMVNGLGVLFAPDALLLGRSIALQGDIYFDKGSKSYFIDSWFSEGAIPDRWEACGAVFGGGAENTDIGSRAARKATVTRALS